MKKITIVVMFITILSKILGFGRDIAMSSTYGVSAITDAFNLANTIPSSVLAVVGAALVTGIIPMLTRLSKESKERTNRFTSNVLNIMLVFCAVMMLIMFIVPEFVIFIFASKLSAEAVAYAVPFLRVISLGLFSIAIVQLGTGFLNVKKNFIIPALVTLPANIVIIAAIFLSRSTGNIMLLAYGQLAALLLQAVIIIVYMIKSDFKYYALIDFKDGDLRLMISLALPLLLSAFLGQFNDIVMKNYASGLHADGTGGYSYMTYATKLIGFVSGIFISAILNVTYPTIAHNVVEGDNKKINKSINDAVLMISVFVIPAMVGFVTLAHEIVEFVFLNGKMTPADIDIIVPIFIFDSLVLFAMAIRELLFRIHYAYHDMKSPVKNTVLVSITFVIGMFIFTRVFGYFGQPLAGLSFAYSLSAIIACFPIYKSAKRLIGKVYPQFIIRDLLKIIAASLIMGIVALLVKGPIAGFMPGKMGTIVVIAVAGLTYIIGLIALRTRFVLNLVGSFINR
ncbi:murein biosynthesis integral membrane protein MurJ [Erysipelothrix sp. HDW6C]|uniref:murein biosynthesis integral membrane protein MurJ n=1 Tax=Erysipelothrix sp. HDW6C TaxID=2714930 RepID=UPI00140DA4BD|nr:murein biosynthesis integral membrane protein MurJ [Erysipelothrix sp. HDW6C]QIK70376.1 murein biosynthesis integral membrane protein MurJ [Erysipelothrix sp. HDW6C]